MFDPLSFLISKIAVFKLLDDKNDDDDKVAELFDAQLLDAGNIVLVKVNEDVVSSELIKLFEDV